jgi:ribosomal protein S18 acetylase RimI-like enzyme
VARRATTEGVEERGTAVVRPGTSADHRFVFELASRAFAGLGDYGPIVGDWLGRREAAAWIASEENVGLGIAVVLRRARPGFLSPPLAELGVIAVSERRRGEGLGRRLLRAAEETAREWGAVEMRLHTAASNAIARAFFAAAGYRLATGASRYPSGAKALAMARSLGEASGVRQVRRSRSSSR